MKKIEFDSERLSIGDIIHHNFQGKHSKFKFLGFSYVDGEIKMIISNLRNKKISLYDGFLFENIKRNLTIEKSLKEKIQKILKI